MDKQMIKEMAKVYCRNGFKCGENCQTNGCRVYEVCTNLYNAGYRKIPENAVVLTDEDEIKQYKWSKMLDKMGFFKFVDKIRKETAEKFALKLADYFVENCGGRLCLSLTLQEWYKMIYEICKEITEGK